MTHGAPLSRHCSIRPGAGELDTVVFRGTHTAIGEFRCPPLHPAFRDSGPISENIVVFPRTSVWIAHEGSRAFVADPTVVTIYSRAQRYERAPILPEGDRCDWFAVDDATARDITVAFDPSAADRERGIFPVERALSTPDLYLRQRVLAVRASRGIADGLETEEGVVEIVAAVMRQAFGTAPRPLAKRRSAAEQRAELVERAKAELLRNLAVNQSAGDVARAIGTSVYHLCRIFRAGTGRTMHAYRTELRLRVALEHLADANSDATLSAVAHELGFSSHSHFSTLCRRCLGVGPASLRHSLLTPHCSRTPHPSLKLLT